MRKGLYVFLFYFCALFLEDVHGAALRSAEEITAAVYVSCSQNRFDEFLVWLKETDISKTNQRLKDEQRLAFSERIDPGVYRNWKEKYYTNFGTTKQVKAFLFAGELYPFIEILQSTVLSFYDLSPVTRICILLSGKLGNPVASNILLFEDVDGKESGIEEMLDRSLADDQSLVELLQTPFAWNNIQTATALKGWAKTPRFINLVTQSHQPFVLLNGFFADSETGVSAHAVEWLKEAMVLGSGLASIRLQRLGQLFSDVLPTVKANLAMQQAVHYRYSILDRSTANRYYLTALENAPNNPLLHMEMAGFYKDLCVAEAYDELSMDQPMMIHMAFYHYKQAHEKGDGEAALEAIKFLKLLQKAAIILSSDFSAGWGLPHTNIAESLTQLYEATYSRREETLFLEKIKQLNQRTQGQINDLSRRRMLETNYRQSLYKLHM